MCYLIDELARRAGCDGGTGDPQNAQNGERSR